MISVCDEEEVHNSDDGMDWETMNDENQSINSNSNNTSTRSSAYTANGNMNETKDSKSKKSGPPASLKLECIEGPHSGETLELTGTIVIGTRQASVRDKIQMGNSVFRILKI